MWLWNPLFSFLFLTAFFQGEWKPKQIDNPDYQGEWVHPQISNPKYEPDDNLYKCNDFGSLKLNLWQVSTILEASVVWVYLTQSCRINDGVDS